MKNIIFKTVFTAIFVIWGANDLHAQKKSTRELKFDAEQKFNKKIEQQKQSEIKAKRRPPREVEVQFEWRIKNFPLQWKMYEAPLSIIDRALEDQNVKDLRSAVPFGREIKGEKFKMTGKHQMFIVTAQNTTNENVWFYAAPHSTEPVEEAVGIKFYCLCHGKPFRIKPGRTWYRIVMLKTYPSNRHTSFKFTHNIYGVSADEIPKADRIGEL